MDLDDHNSENKFCAVHAWGLNFETKNTTDYRYFITECGTNFKNRTEIINKLNDIIHCIFKASNTFHKGKYHQLRIPPRYGVLFKWNKSTIER